MCKSCILLNPYTEILDFRRTMETWSLSNELEKVELKE